MFISWRKVSSSLLLLLAMPARCQHVFFFFFVAAGVVWSSGKDGPSVTESRKQLNLDSFYLCLYLFVCPSSISRVALPSFSCLSLRMIVIYDTAKA